MKPAERHHNNSDASTDHDLAVPTTPGAEYAPYNGGAKAKAKRTRMIHMGLGIFVLVNIIVLYVLHFADRGNNSESHGTAAGTIDRKDLSVSNVVGVKEDYAMSFGPDGKLRVGAGTTAYLEAATLPDASNKLQYIKFAKTGVSKPFYNDILMSYQQSGADGSVSTVLTTCKADLATKKVTIAPVRDGNTLAKLRVQGMVALSDKLAMVLAIEDHIKYYTAHLVPVTLGDNGAISVLADNQVMAVNNSATSFLTRLSDNTFAVTYFEPYSATEEYSQRVKLGQVSDSGKVSFVEGADSKFGLPNVKDMSTQFGRPIAVGTKGQDMLVPWYTDDMAATKANLTISGSKGLCVTPFSFDGKVLNSSAAVCNPNYQPAYLLSSAKLTDNVGALMFYNRATNFALTLVTVEFSPLTGAPTFRSTYVLEEASGAFEFGLANFGFYPEPVFHVLSNNRVAIAFLNPSNAGKPSVKVIKFSSDLSFDELSPLMPIAKNDFTVAANESNAAGSISMDVMPLEMGFLTAFAGSWAGKQQQRLSLVESYGKPVGVVSNSKSSEVSVAMSGTVKVNTKLTSGKSYYASTEGTLYTPSSNTDDSFVLAKDGDIVLSKDGLVGVALSSDKLFVASTWN
ncbi:TPA: hypothetical protein N0F65_004592 [Lagenidium giganteum]|uniref:Uncharacterized protein n=1 Tax=Lagenidium giganteum TaxID=4803 RepID=A0AAV2ZEI8_9STRA|nr:TPA: hypothetical protein N0F65_004592 [Lagenidium giganteum]